MASTAISFAFQPHRIDNEWYVDGGITGNILLWEGIERCEDTDEISVDIVLCTPMETQTKLPNKLTLFELLKALYGIAMNQI